MDVPPPPYTEADIYSHSGRPTNSQPGSNDDAASITETSSSTTIYTPPETPRESLLDFGDDDHLSSVHSYFESRPTNIHVSGSALVASLAASETSSPDDFPYPAWARERDTTEQDWHTFLNYLLPEHVLRASSHVVDRKVQEDVRDIDAVIREWNDGFFGPRGVTIRRQPPFPTTTSARTPIVGQAPVAEPQPEPQPQFQEQNNRSRWNPFRPFDVSNRGVRLGGLTIDNDRVAFGNSFEVDRNGVRWNGQSLDPNRSGPNPPAPGVRDRAPSISSSSSSSGRSESSIGSLPDWDDLKDAQLPVAKQSVAAWLAHPEQPVTKDMLKTLRSDIKAAKNASPPEGTDKKALRQEVKAMLARFKELKREQKKAARAARKQRRAERRGIRRERRDQIRERRRQSRGERRNHPPNHSRDASDRQYPEYAAMPHHPAAGLFNNNNHVPSPPTIPNTPDVPFIPRASTAPTIPNPPPGIFGARWPLGGNRAAIPSWQRHVLAARATADQARSRAHASSEQARNQAHATADQARSQAHATAEQARNHAHASAEQARSRAHATSEQARNQAHATAEHARNQAHATAQQARAQAAAEQARGQAHAQQARAQAQAQADHARLRVSPVQSFFQAQANARTHADFARMQAAAAAARWTGGGLGAWGQGVPGPAAPPAAAPVSAGASTNAAGAGAGAVPLDAKYARADELEAQMVRRAEDLHHIQAMVEREGIEAAKRGDGDAKNREQTTAQKEAEMLEAQLEDLAGQVDRLRLEADEEFARNMMEEEKRNAGR